MRSSRKPGFSARTALLLLVAAPALVAPACSETLQTTYLVKVEGPQEAFVDGLEMSLEFGARELDRASIVPGRPVSLSTKDIQAEQGQTGAFKVRVLGAGGTLVAFGQSPSLEVIRTNVKAGEPNPVLSVFVQRQGTFGDLDPLSSPVRNHAAVAVDAAKRGSTLRLGAVVIVGGEELVPGPMSAPVERLSNQVQAFNPYNLLVKDLLSIGTIGSQPHYRSEAGIFARPDGQILVFGGRARATAGAGETEPSGQLDVFSFFREGLLDVTRTTSVSSPPPQGIPGLARVRPVIADAGADLLLAIGGRDKDGPLDTLVRLQVREQPKLLTLRLAAKRAGHTATTVPGKNGPEILVLGGNDDGPLAEVILPPTSTTSEPTLAPMVAQTAPETATPRRDHAALRLPDGKLLILGGVAGSPPVPLDSSLVYEPATRSLSPGRLRLRTPRAGFAAFVVGEDLVIAGGRDATGALVDSADIYDTGTLDWVATVKCRGRVGATATPVGTGGVVLIGGEVTSGSTGASIATNAIEHYQPRSAR